MKGSGNNNLSVLRWLDWFSVSALPKGIAFVNTHREMLIQLVMKRAA